MREWNSPKWFDFASYCAFDSVFMLRDRRSCVASHPDGHRAVERKTKKEKSEREREGRKRKELIRASSIWKHNVVNLR